MKATIASLFLALLLLLNSRPVWSQIPADTSVRMKCGLDNNYLCPDKKEVYLYIDLTGSSGAKRVPLNLSLVLDRSGSMEEDERMVNAQIAVNYLIDHLSSDDNLSIVTYDHFVDVMHGSTPVTDKKHLKHKIDRIFPRGATNISGGLTKGYEEVKSTYSADRLNRVLLLSDGLANEGITDHYLLDLIAKNQADENNISLSTFGMGHSFNEKLMHDLAESGAGNFYYIERSEDASIDFGTEIRLLLGVVAKNAKLSINYPSQYLTLSRVYGHSYSSAKDRVNIDLKEVHPNEANGILLKFTVKEPITGPVNFENILTYSNAHNQQAVEKRQVLTLMPSDDDEVCKKNFDRDVLNKVVYFTSNYLLETAITDVDNGNIKGAHDKLNQAKETLGNSRELPADSNLKKQYDAVDEYHESVGNIHKLSHHEKKLLQKKARHKNYKLRKLKQ
jgi:Ca-activated chloride channel homolog